MAGFAQLFDVADTTAAVDFGMPFCQSPFGIAFSPPPQIIIERRVLQHKLGTQHRATMLVVGVLLSSACGLLGNVISGCNTT